MFEIKDRRILLSEEINERSAKDIIEKIFNINIDDDKKEAKYQGFKREPIELYINSPGGTVYDGLAIVDAIKNSKTPVHTYCIGQASSMAFIVFLSGEERFAGKYATFIIHEISKGVLGKVQSIKDSIKESERLQSILDSIILENTNIVQSQLDWCKKDKAEWYICTQEGVKLGICQEIPILKQMSIKNI